MRIDLEEYELDVLELALALGAGYARAAGSDPDLFHDIRNKIDRQRRRQAT